MSQDPMKILIDGECPLCRREAAMLRKMDRGRGRLEVLDYNDPSVDPQRWGLSHDAVDARIHAILPGGRVITGMSVFRAAYDAVGWGWLAAPTGWPVLKPAFDRLYKWFARNRHRLTGRADGCERCRA